MANPRFSCSVAVQALAEQTHLEQGLYAFSYTVTIENTGDVLAQLIGRHWEITDARGQVQIVDGLAVVELAFARLSVGGMESRWAAVHLPWR